VFLKNASKNIPNINHSFFSLFAFLADLTALFSDAICLYMLQEAVYIDPITPSSLMAKRFATI